MPTLEIDQEGARRSVTLDADTVTIGRDAGNVLVIEHIKVSRFHCKLTRVDGGYQLEDLGSGAGTRVDGQRVTRSRLRSGQTVSLGPVTLRYQDEAAPGGAPAPPAGDARRESSRRAASADGATPWALYCIDGDRKGTAFAFADRLRIGRSPDCEVILDGTEVSIFHCEVQAAGGALVVRDLGSTNGTVVNGERCEEHPLLPGDRLTLGPHVFHVDRYPLPATRAGVGVGRALAEVGLFVAIALMLWTLGVRLVARPLLGGTNDTAGGASFLELGERGEPANYRFQGAGDWDVKPLPDVDRLRVTGRAGAEQLRVVLVHAHRAVGQRVQGHVAAAQDELTVSLIGYYRDGEGRLLSVRYSPRLKLPAGERAIAFDFPPLDGAQWLQAGYLLEGAVREATLGPLQLAPQTSQPTVERATVRRDWGALELGPGGRFRFAVDGLPLGEGELGDISAATGEMVSCLRHVEPPARVVSDPRGALLAGTQVAVDATRHPFQLRAAPVDTGLGVALTGGRAGHLRWTWRSPPRAALFYRGVARKPGEPRPLVDEVVVATGAGPVTLRCTPAVYLEQRWIDDRKREAWQLRFAPPGKADALRVELYRGDRQRERELQRVQGTVERWVARGAMPEALRALQRWRALAEDPDAPALQAAVRKVRRAVDAIVDPALAADGPDAQARLLTLLAEYRGTLYEEPLEAEVTRRLLAGDDPKAGEEEARWLLAEGRHLAVQERYALARAALELLVTRHPKRPEAAQALRLLPLLPRR